MSYVITPLGVVMHVDSHRQMVEIAEKSRNKMLLSWLLPARPFDSPFLGIDRQVHPTPFSAMKNAAPMSVEMFDDVLRDQLIRDDPDIIPIDRARDPDYRTRRR